MTEVLESSRVSLSTTPRENDLSLRAHLRDLGYEVDKGLVQGIIEVRGEVDPPYLRSFFERFPKHKKTEDGTGYQAQQEGVIYTARVERQGNSSLILTHTDVSRRSPKA